MGRDRAAGGDFQAGITQVYPQPLRPARARGERRGGRDGDDPARRSAARQLLRDVGREPPGGRPGGQDRARARPSSRARRGRARNRNAPQVSRKSRFGSRNGRPSPRRPGLRGRGARARCCSVEAGSLLPACGEKVRMRGGEKPRPIARPLSPALSDSTPRDGLGPNSFPGGAAEGARRAPGCPTRPVGAPPRRRTPCRRAR